MGIINRTRKQYIPPSPVTATARSLEEIEVALAEHVHFHFVRNIVAFNVIGESRCLPIFHECDVLVCSKSGYLTEIEIKRSWKDFLADFRKKHRHGFRYGTSTKFFFYCLPSGCLEAAYEELDRHADELFYSGIITYDEDLNLEIHGRRFHYQLDNRLKVSYSVTSRSADPLFIEQRLELARLGCMRVVRMKKNIIKESCNIKDSKEE